MKMAKKKKLENLKKRHNRYIKSLGVNIDVDTGEIMSSFEGYPFPDLSTDPNYPKCSDKIPVGTGIKKEAQQYSGKRKLLGIGIMHKSNLVPIWDEEGAKEISKMRRN